MKLPSVERAELRISRGNSQNGTITSKTLRVSEQRLRTMCTVTAPVKPGPVLVVRSLSKSFAGIKVLKGINLDVLPGEVHALMGENGAGKSTFIKTVSGLHRPDAGEIIISGEVVSLTSPRDARRLGISVVHQELLLFPELTVAENVYLGHAPRRWWGGIDWTHVRIQTRKILDDLDCPDLDIDANVGALSIADRQRVEIAKALSSDARLLIMDEPTAALAEADVSRLMEIVSKLRARGVAIIYVSHRMPEILTLADRVSVLRDGALIGTHEIKKTSEAALVTMMVGREIAHLFPKIEVPIGAPVLELSGVNCGSKVRDITLTVRSGEIVGIAGLVGSGRTELALTVFGVTPAVSGEIRLDGHAVAVRDPRQARDLGIGYVPEDRGLQGLVRAMTVAENGSMAVLDRIALVFIVNYRRERLMSVRDIKRFGVRTRGPGQPVHQLSGGNQQKVVLGKWLAAEPRVLIMDEPTRGIDVGAKSEIHALMGRLAASGLAILMISSELPEVLGMSDRVLVMNAGRIVAEFPRAEATPEAVGAAMTTVPSEADAAKALA